MELLSIGIANGFRRNRLLSAVGKVKIENDLVIRILDDRCLLGRSLSIGQDLLSTFRPKRLSDFLNFEDPLKFPFFIWDNIRTPRRSQDRS